jgi:hypothetical protein
MGWRLSPIACLLVPLPLLLLPAPDPHPTLPRCLFATAVLLLLWTVSTVQNPALPALLVPSFLFPALGVLETAAVGRAYWNNAVALFVGCWLVGVGVSRVGGGARLGAWVVRLAVPRAAKSGRPGTAAAATALRMMPQSDNNLDDGLGDDRDVEVRVHAGRVIAVFALATAACSG